MSIFSELEGMDDILNDFVTETKDLVEQLDIDLLELEKGSGDKELVNRIFRAFHTIKGTSGFLNFTACTELAHVAEDLLNRIRNGEITPTPDKIDLLLESVDWIKNFIIDVVDRNEKEYDIQPLITKLTQYLEPSAQEADAPNATAAPRPSIISETELPAELVNEFITEANELLQTLNNDILSLEIETNNQELINQVYRVFHTIKGNAGLIGQSTIAEVAHRAEDILTRIRDNHLEPTTEIIDGLLDAADFLKNCIDDLQQGKKPVYDTASLEKHLQGMAEETKPVVNPASKTVPEARQDTPEKRNAARSEQTIRVDVEKLDNLVNLAGELILEKNRLLQLTENLNHKYSGVKEVGELEGLNNSLGYITTEIQESVMKMRMLPIANLFRKYPRTVRDLARDKHKEIDLITEGEETELDRSVIEAISDPLVHILRNAIDHGIELPADRIKKGKSPRGTIKMSAFQEGNHIVIWVKDDGAGIDPNKIAAKAIEKQLVSPDALHSMSRREIINLIFEPGFSTAEVVTDVSGRGVGLDVVHSNISKLNGTVEIETEVDKGTSFIIKLPLTLTIMTGMVVKVWDEYYIIPLNLITDTLKLDDFKINTIKGQEVIRLRDLIIPLVRLDEKLAVPPIPGKRGDKYVVVIAIAEKHLGLVVSELIKQEETVVKSLGNVLGKVPMISGASIRGDGRISLILDVPEIVEIITRNKTAMV
jgi:two-component system chemotaxis sensor kinase CheA